jgi:hypothetical protein
MVKLIFLDLDGVLVTRFPGVFEPQLVRNLKRVVDATGAEIVLSSDWRRTPCALEDARRNLRSFGMDCIGYTPCLSPSVPQRPKEILMWKDDHHENGGSFVTAWVAIDDRPLLDEEKGMGLRGHFVQTDENIGFEGPCVEDAIHLLNREQSSSPRGSHGLFIHGFASREGEERNYQDRHGAFEFANLMQRNDPMSHMRDSSPGAQFTFERDMPKPWAEHLQDSRPTSPQGSSLRPLSAHRQLPPRIDHAVAAKGTLKTIMSYGPKEEDEPGNNRYPDRKFGWPEVPHSRSGTPRGKMMDLTASTPRGKVLDVERMSDNISIRPRTPTHPQVVDISTSSRLPLAGSRPTTPHGRHASNKPKIIDMGAINSIQNKEYRPSTAPRSRAGSLTSQCQILDMESKLPDVQNTRNMNMDSRSRSKSPVRQPNGPTRPSQDRVRAQRPDSGRHSTRKEQSPAMEFLSIEPHTPKRPKENKYAEPMLRKSPNMIGDLFDNRRSGGRPAKNMEFIHHGSSRSPTPSEFTHNERAEIHPLGHTDLGFSEHNSMVPKEPSSPKRGSSRGGFRVWDFRY